MIFKVLSFYRLDNKIYTDDYIVDVYLYYSCAKILFRSDLFSL